MAIRKTLVGIFLMGLLGLVQPLWPETPDEQQIRSLWAELTELMDSLPEDRRRALWQELQESFDPEAIVESSKRALDSAAETSRPAETTEPEAGAQEPAKVQVSAKLPEPTETPEPAEVAVEVRPSEAPRTTEDELEAEPVAQALDSTEPPASTGRRRACRVLDMFDSDGDQKFTGLDRYWRHFYLWLDRDGDRQVDEKELIPPYEKGVRQIPLHLRSFVRGKKKRARELPILNEQYLLLDLDHDGWAGPFPTAKDGALAADFDAIRESGGPSFIDSQGRTVSGKGAFQPGWSRVSDQGAVALGCPRP